MTFMTKVELKRAKQNRDAVNQSKLKSKDLVSRKYKKPRLEEPAKKTTVKVVWKPAGTAFDELRRRLGKR